MMRWRRVKKACAARSSKNCYDIAAVSVADGDLATILGTQEDAQQASQHHDHPRLLAAPIEGGAGRNHDPQGLVKQAVRGGLRQGVQEAPRQPERHEALTSLRRGGHAISQLMAHLLDHPQSSGALGAVR
jgi:hypothetical protein